jgi:hypothetical protein
MRANTRYVEGKRFETILERHSITTDPMAYYERSKPA